MTDDLAFHSDEALATFADVVLPLHLQRTYTYRIPLEFAKTVQPGMRVAVQFGAKKVYSGIIQLVHHKPPVGYEAKYILSFIDDAPILGTDQLKFWEWIASYYCAHLGDVMQLALPAALKLESETTVCLAEDFEEQSIELDDREYLIIEALHLRKELRIQEIEAILQLKNTLPYLKSLVSKNAIVLKENLADKYKEKKITCLRIAAHLASEHALQEVFTLLEKKEKQLAVLMCCFQLQQQMPHIPKKTILEKTGVSDSSIQTLIKNGYLESYQLTIDRIQLEALPPQEFSLNDIQTAAFNSIETFYQEKDVVLLHGITSSGKTHVYVKLIEAQIKAGKQVLMLLPEIALTAQIIQRLKKYFGNTCMAFHSKFSDAERVEIWNKVNKQEIQLIIGARSALFLPFHALGLVIVDEEHESSYKQQDPAPRYHARESAIMLAKMMGAKVLLGSATPSIESYTNALNGKYGLVEMHQRFGEIPQPEMVLANLAEENRTKTIVGNYFSSTLVHAIQTALDKHEQIILFQNRRGYAPILECETCKWIPKCVNCDISLTYHKYNQSLSCHYCGYQIQYPSNCHACPSSFLNLKGFGTEKLEDEIGILFPAARIARLDFDTTRTKHGHEKIIQDFESHAADILIGTQMLSKGLDFEKVSLVGVVNADQLLFFPDFRAHERAFQLIAQVSGRAGRKHKQGKVIVQTANPSHPVIQFILQSDYKGLYNFDLLERKKFGYPPEKRIIKLSIKHKDLKIAKEASWQLKQLLSPLFKEQILGPEAPFVSKIRNYYIREILLKIDKEDKQLGYLKQGILFHIQQLNKHPHYKSVWVSIDVDPV